MDSVKYLVKVDANNNNNKFYRMIPYGNCFRVEYGRLGNSSFRTQTYPINMWYTKYLEKINKGYVDHSNLIEDQIIVVKNQNLQYKEIEDKAVAELINRLQLMARQVTDKNYRVEANKVTPAMIREAQQLINLLVDAVSIEAFNEILEKLFAVIPRRMDKVINYLAFKEDEFDSIIEREQNLLDAMAGQVSSMKSSMQEDISAASNTDKTILEVLGLTIRPVNSKEESSIKKMLGRCAPQYVNAWRVENVDTRKRYREFKKQNGITDTMLLFHGSRNENWFNIIKSGLLLRPTNVVITGKMFGYGIYFAKKAAKSIGYTSLIGSRWANGRSNTGFLALYDVATGTPFDVYSHKPEFSTLDKIKLQSMCPGANCLYAHKGSMLHEDEIVIYDEAQATIKFLVEMRY